MERAHRVVSQASLIVATLFLALSLSPCRADAEPRTHLGVRARDMLALSGAVAVGGSVDLGFVGSGGDFAVPEDKAFVLTDFIISPQTFATSGTFTIVVVSANTNNRNTAIVLTTSAANPSSFQVNLTSGMVFPSGSIVRAFLTSGVGPIAVSAFGYLTGDRHSDRPGRD